MATRTAAAQEAERERFLRRRIEGEALIALAELAADVEELLVSDEASTATVIDRLRARTEMAGLTTVGTAGETAAYDPTRHSLLAGTVTQGAPVVVLRPGHLYRDTLIAKAIVYNA